MQDVQFAQVGIARENRWRRRCSMVFAEQALWPLLISTTCVSTRCWSDRWSVTDTIDEASEEMSKVRSPAAWFEQRQAEARFPRIARRIFFCPFPGLNGPFFSLHFLP